MRYLAIALLLGLSACTDFPELGTSGADAARRPYPDLLPYDQVIAATAAEPQAEDTAAVLAARAAALRARADALMDEGMTDADRRLLSP